MPRQFSRRVEEVEIPEKVRRAFRRRQKALGARKPSIVRMASTFVGSGLPSEGGSSMLFALVYLPCA